MHYLMVIHTLVIEIFSPSGGWINHFINAAMWLKGVIIMFSLSFDNFRWLVSTRPRVLWGPSLCAVEFPLITHLLMVSHVTINVSTPALQIWLDLNIWLSISYMSKHCYRWRQSWQTTSFIFGTSCSPISFPIYLSLFVFTSFFVYRWVFILISKILISSKPSCSDKDSMYWSHAA